MDSLSTLLLQQDGAFEAPWSQAPCIDATPLIDVATLIAGARRAVVVAAQPHDEVLGSGGLLADMAGFGLDTLIVAVTDGECSHAGSRTWSRAGLRDKRVTESMQALNVLGVDPLNVMRLRIRHGYVRDAYDELSRRLVDILRPGDIVFAPWAGSGDADHEGCNNAVSHAVLEHAMSDEAPVWMWNWADPGAAALPLSRVLRVEISADALARKQRALALCETQLHRDPDVPGTPHLSADKLARFLRPYESLLYAPDI